MHKMLSNNTEFTHTLAIEAIQAYMPVRPQTYWCRNHLFIMLQLLPS